MRSPDTASPASVLWHGVAALMLACIVPGIPATVTAQQPFATTPELARARLGIIENPALADDASAIWINPAGLGLRQTTSGFISHSFRTDASYSNLMFSGSHVGVGWQRADAGSSIRMDRWRIAGAGEIGGGIALGAALQYADPSRAYGTGSFWAWDLGVAARPARFLSLGTVVRNLRSPGTEAWTVEAGVGIRPVGDRLTVFAGSIWADGDEYNDPSHWHAGAMVNAGPGIEMSVAVNQDRMVKAGLSLVLGQGSFGAHGVKDGGSYGPVWAVARFHEDFRRSVLVRSDRVARIDLSGDIRDYRSFSLFGGTTYPLRSIVAQIDRAAQSPDVAALYVKIGRLTIGQGMAEELRSELVRFREKTGKPVICHVTGPRVKEYYIATAADSIFLEPTSHVLVNGYSAAPPLMRGLLDKIGLEPQFVRVGEYKSASELLTDSTLSNPYREQLTGLLDDWYGRLIATISDSRAMPPDSVVALVDRGLFSAADAVRFGLVDGERSHEDAVKSAQAATGSGERPTVDLAERSIYDERWGKRPKIAVVYAFGDMVTGSGGIDIITGGAQMGSERIAGALKEVREDDDIRAVVLRISSGGGYALAAEQIWREADALAESEKPFIVSVGDVAASGAYYIAAPANTIMSNPGAIVGSIGILYGKISAGELFEKIGVNVEGVQRGKNADLLALRSSLSEEQLALAQDFIEQGYDIFVGRVSSGRGMTAAAVDSVGQGRIFTGDRGIEAGLVDEIGGLSDAIRIALDKAGITQEAEIVAYPKRASIFERMATRDRISAGFRNDSEGIWLYDPVAEIVR